MSIARNISFLRSLPKLRGVPAIDIAMGGGSRLTEKLMSGSNPGNLRMYTFIPDDLPEKVPLVVVLHGCTQSAAGYAVGAGWSTLAERFGFVLLMPEQQRANNANVCFNWFEPQDTARGQGEARSIQQMIEQMANDRTVDKRRIFITGLSAGGAMTSVMLAAYPELFAAGAVIAGLPYGIANNLQEALSGMFQPAHRSAGELGDLIRRASNHDGKWPRVSVWHGSSDRTVNPRNADYIVSQWLDVHKLPAHPMSEDLVDGHSHQIWWDSKGKNIVESFTIADMAHGTPLGLAENDEKYGIEGAFLLEAGISSSYHIAKFFGLTESIHKAKAADAELRPPSWVSTLPKKRQPQAASGTLSISATINDALKAAGLMR